jgi:general secretion pathway protein E
VISEKGRGKEGEPQNADSVGDSAERTFLTADSFESMDWWTGLADLDRINILSAPLEDRARLLASKYSSTLEETMLEIGKKAELSYVEDFELPDNPTKLLPLRLIHSYSCLPVGGEDEGKLNLVTVWPPSERMSRWIFAVSGKKPIWFLGSPEKISRAITENFGIGAESLDDSDLDIEGEEEAQDDLEDQNAAIIRFVNEVIQRAIVDRATDIHFEPHKETLQIRYRIDGQLVPVRVPDNLRSFQDAIISRIKIMSAINISEKRRPQGGRITFSQGQSDLDIRVSTLPTLYGESISLRLLNEKSQPLSMRELGLMAGDEKNIVSVLEKPHGIVLVTGPTGSGKSTSLTAFIRRIHKPERRIMTVEDPVEYEVAGINQTQVNSEIGFTFASALREILRQDPDVIMVGEIRDRETADIAIRASLTGHLVLSTLHTNDAPGAITRLVDMEIEPFLIASSVEMVIAQRLVRRLCQKCSLPVQMSESDMRASLSLLEVDPRELVHGTKVLRAVGCQNCQNLGYRGRVGIFELMRMSDQIHGLVIKNASAPDIREIALEEGMSTLQGSGWEQIKRGYTTFDEVIRYADGFVDEEPTQPFFDDSSHAGAENPAED